MYLSFSQSSDVVFLVSYPIANERRLKTSRARQRDSRFQPPQTNCLLETDVRHPEQAKGVCCPILAVSAARIDRGAQDSYQRI